MQKIMFSFFDSPSRDKAQYIFFPVCYVSFRKLSGLYSLVLLWVSNFFYSFNYCINNDTRWYCQIEMSELGEKQDAINNKEVNESGIREILYLPRNFSGDRIWKYFGSDYNACISAYNCMKEVAQKLRIYGCK